MMLHVVPRVLMRVRVTQRFWYTPITVVVAPAEMLTHLVRVRVG